MHLALAALALALQGVLAAPPSTDRPIVGILTLPTDERPGSTSYFPASYVKWVESGGARAAPVIVGDPGVPELLPQLNGFLFTGGGVEFYFPNKTLTPYSQTALDILNTVRAAHAAGQTVPIWGTCLGFQLLTFVASGPNVDDPVVGCPPFDSEDLHLALDPTSAWEGSRFQQSAAAGGGVDTILTTQGVTPNFHHCGVTPEAFKGNSNLTSTFGPEPLTTNVGRQGKQFVSTIEGVELPLYGTQWHPEKAVFEWTLTHNTVHNDSSVKANGWTSKFFIDEARRNDRSFSSPQAEAKALIYNYEPVYTLDSQHFNEFEQCYFF